MKARYGSAALLLPLLLVGLGGCVEVTRSTGGGSQDIGAGDTAAAGCAGDDSLCDDGDPCTVGRCEDDGSCVQEPSVEHCALDGGACVAIGAPDPADPCRICAADTARAAWGDQRCDDGNACTVDTCEPGVGCRFTSDDALPCDDGIACTTDDHCVGGTCIASACECEADADCAEVPAAPCRRMVCKDYACVDTSDLDADGASCTVDPCLEGATCSAGACVGGTAKDCSGAAEGACRPGACDPASGACVAIDAEVGAACDDGDPCTIGDACAGGACAGAAMDCSDLVGPCVDAACVDGACDATVKVGEACDPGNACIEGALCDGAGNCKGTWSAAEGCQCATDQDCDDGLGCTKDTCAPTTGACTFTPLPSLCVIAGGCYYPEEPNPLDPCEECRPSVSQDAWAPVSCDDGNPCTADSCEAGVGCAHAADDAAACDDGDPCSSNDACVAGECVGDCECTTAADCLDDGIPLAACEKVACVGFRCKPAADPGQNGAACATGDLCVVGAACLDGACVGGEPVVCETAGTPGCAAAACDPQTGTCAVSYAASGAPCDDADPCTEGDVCDGQGACAGVTKDCSAFVDACNAAACQAGTCVQLPQAGEACDDGEPCTSGDVCDPSGGCAGTWDAGIAGCGCAIDGDCDDGLACTVNTCQTGNLCKTEVKAGSCLIGGACYAAGEGPLGNACQVCDPAVTATKWQPVTCNDGNPCTDDSCDPAAGCVALVDDQNPCSDGDPCSSDDHCDAGACVGSCECREDGDCQGTPAPCKRLACQAYACVEVADAAKDGAACEDGKYCTAGDKCQGGTCQPGPARDCSAAGAGACVVGVCDEGGDACAPANAPGGTPCDDGDPCSLDDACAAGQCVGAPLDCSPLEDACHVAECVDGTCQQTATAGAPCDDGEGCTLGDACTSDGLCAGTWDTSTCGCDGDAACASLSDACNLGSCDIASHTCSPTPLEGQGCDDQDACTTGDACSSAGVCAGAIYSCSDNLGCTDDVCDGVGGCSNPVKAGRCLIAGACYLAGDANPANPCQVCTSGTAWSADDAASCDDGDPCTHSDACSAGACAGTAYACDYLPACQTAQCDGNGGCNVTTLAGHCVIDGACVAAGTVDPGNPCRSCLPTVSKTAWSPNAATCDDGDPCTYDDLCSGGACGGVAYACSDGKPCTDDVCDGAGDCAFPVATGCLIAGACRAEGADDPNNPCRYCDSAAAATAWTPRVAGTTCDDGLDCTDADQCDGAGLCKGSDACAAAECEIATCSGATCDVQLRAGFCKIDGVCWVDETVDPDNPCRKCDADLATGAWTPLSAPCDDGDPCTHTDVCSAGACGGIAYGCDDGKACTADSCDGLGGCAHAVVPDTCLISGTCWAHGTPDPGQPCRACDASVAQGSWTNLPNGSACPDDGLACTSDACAAGQCVHEFVNTLQSCLIDGVCYGKGESNPGNTCELCSPERDPFDWSPRPDGTVCGTGGSACTSVTCVGGSCQTQSVADFGACDDGDPATSGDWCYGGACDGFVRELHSTITADLEDTYERASVGPSGQVYGVYVTRDESSCDVYCAGCPKYCWAPAQADHFVASTKPAATYGLSPAVELSGDYSLGRPGLAPDRVAIEYEMLEWASGWTSAPWFFTSTGMGREALHAQLTTEVALELGFDPADTTIVADSALGVATCYHDESGMESCVDDYVDLLNSMQPAGIVAVDTTPYLVGTDGSRVRIFANTGIDYIYGGNLWTSVASGNVGSNRYARASATADKDVVIVGDAGLLLVYGEGVLRPVSAVGAFTQRSATRFVDVEVFGGRVFALGWYRTTQGSAGTVRRTFVLVHGPVGSKLDDGATWRAHTVAVGEGACPWSPCSIDTRLEMNSLVPGADKLWIFGGWMDANGAMDKAVWLWPPPPTATEL